MSKRKVKSLLAEDMFENRRAMATFSEKSFVRLPRIGATNDLSDLSKKIFS